VVCGAADSAVPAAFVVPTQHDLGVAVGGVGAVLVEAPQVEHADPGIGQRGRDSGQVGLVGLVLSAPRHGHSSSASLAR